MTAAKKTAAKRVPARSAPVVATQEPTGRWAQVLAETRAAGRGIDDFEVTADLVLHPPNPDRSKALTTSQWAYQSAMVAVANAIQNGASQAELDEIGKTVEDSEKAYHEALLGGPDKVAAVDAYFRGRGTWEKEAFVRAIKEQFLRLPPDGKCPTCGQVNDPEQVGKGNESSTSSSTTGMTSKETVSSEESTPETGAEAPDPGPNS